MPFCENCGTKLTPEALFCENCGAKLGNDSVSKITDLEKVGTDDLFAVFSDGNWPMRWLEAAHSVGDRELGIILTREQELSKNQLGMPDPAPFRECIKRYIHHAEQRGVAYHYLNLENFTGSNSLQENLSLLRQVVAVARPKYLFIIGNESVVNFGVWDNEAGDSDLEVSGDLPYAILDSASPWEGQSFDFKDSLRVGRLPNASDDDFDSFSNYFEYAAEHIGKTGSVVPYGLSALVWQRESQEEFSHISPQKVELSPDFTVNNHGSEFESANLLFFNLHGDDTDTEFWFGQEGHDYPKAFSSELITRVGEPHYIGVEACYGAQFADLDTNESILLTALHNGCISFLGSSKIAYGTPEPEGTCADVVIGEYIRGIAGGRCAGDAFAAGLQKLAAKSDLNDSEIKTIAEFSLYGDPSACIGRNPNIGIAKSLTKGARGVPQGLHIPMPDVRRATKLALTSVNARINAMIDDFVQKNYFSLFGGTDDCEITSQTFRLSSLKLNQKMYCIKSSRLKQYVKVYFDDNGNVKTSCISK